VAPVVPELLRLNSYLRQSFVNVTFLLITAKVKFEKGAVAAEAVAGFPIATNATFSPPN
jgi:hypothetical protein